MPSKGPDDSDEPKSNSGVFGPPSGLTEQQKSEWEQTEAIKDVARAVHGFGKQMKGFEDVATPAMEAQARWLNARAALSEVFLRIVTETCATLKSNKIATIIVVTIAGLVILFCAGIGVSDINVKDILPWGHDQEITTPTIPEG